MNTPSLASYFEQQYFDIEQAKLFSQAPQYVAHQLMAVNQLWIINSN